MNTIYQLTTLAFWKAYFVHMRPYLLFVSGVAGFAGMVALDDFKLMEWKTLLIFLPLFLGYGFGQALTDCFQIDTDKLSAPYRPLSQGVVSPKHIGIVSAIGLVMGVSLLVYFNYWNIIFGVFTILGLATYSFFKKRYWFAGPFYNAWIVSLLPIMGFLGMSNLNLSSLSYPSLMWIIPLSFFSYANFVLMGYLKDISADRQTNYQTFTVVFGWDATTWVGDIFVLLSMYFSAQIAFENTWGIIFWSIASIIAILGQGYAHFTKQKVESNASFPITATVRSLILWHLSIVIGLHSNLLLLAVGFYFLFEIVLWARPMKTQI